MIRGLQILNILNKIKNNPGIHAEKMALTMSLEEPYPTKKQVIKLITDLVEAGRVKINEKGELCIAK